MPDHPHFGDHDLVNPQTQHEHTDVNVRALIWFFVIFVVFSILTHIALWYLYKAFVRVEKRDVAPLTQMQRPADAAVPQNQPLLQPFPRQTPGGQLVAPHAQTPVTDLVDMRRAEDQALTSYGWLDKQKGLVRIPIAEAKKMVVQRGLPVRPSGAPVSPPSPPVAATDTGTPAAATSTGGGH